MLGIVESDSMYRKSDQNSKDINRINKYLAEARKAALGEQEEEQITAYIVELALDEKMQLETWNMLLQHENSVMGRLERYQPLNITSI